MTKQQPEFEQFQSDIEYAETHREELLSQYPEQWVAILNQEVVGASLDPHQLIADLKQRSIPTEWIVVRHLTRQEELLIL